jgi:hypothetical protein
MATIEKLLAAAQDHFTDALNYEIGREGEMLEPQTMQCIEFSQAASLLAIARLLNHIVDHGIPTQRGKL